jgi:HPt (histidine-containing phosphotransfer) domain-containing protein
VFEFATLRAATADDREQAAELVMVYLEDAAQTMPRLEAACAVPEPKEIKQLAHRLRGANATMGLARVVAVLERLEQAADAAQTKAFPALLAELREQLAAAKAALEEYCASLEKKPDNQSS